MMGKVRLRIGRWFETEAEADGNIIQGLTSVFGPKGAEAFFLGNGFYVKAMADVPPKNEREDFPTVQVVDGGLYEGELPETLRIDGKPYTLREVIKQAPKSVADDLGEVVQRVDVPTEPRAFEVPDNVIEELENLRSVNGLITGLFEKIQIIESSSGQKEVNLLNMCDTLLIEYIPKLPPEIANVVREMVQAKISKILVGEFLQRKEDITKIGKEGGLNVFEEYGRLLEEYTPKLPETIVTILQRAILVEKAYDTTHQRFIVIESDYRDSQKTIDELKEQLERAKAGADPERIRELEEQLRNAQQSLTALGEDYARLERVARDLQIEKERREASLLGKDAEYQLKLGEAERQNISLSLENGILRQQVSTLEERIGNAKSVFQEQEREYLGNIERLNQEIGRLSGMLKSDAELEVVEISGDGTQPFEVEPASTVSAPENTNMVIDYSQVLGAVAYTIDKLFFSRITKKSEREKISKLTEQWKKKWEDELIAEFREVVPYKKPEGKKISRKELDADFDEYLTKQDAYVQENLQKRLEEAKKNALTQEFYDSNIEGEVKSGRILDAVQRMKLGQNFKEVPTYEKEILTGFFDAFGAESGIALLKGSPIIMDFLLNVYTLMKVKGGVLAYSAIAEEQYNHIKGSFTHGRPVFGRKLRQDDIEKIIELAHSPSLGELDSTPPVPRSWDNSE